MILLWVSAKAVTEVFILGMIPKILKSYQDSIVTWLSIETTVIFGQFREGLNSHNHPLYTPLALALTHSVFIFYLIDEP